MFVKTATVFVFASLFSSLTFANIDPGQVNQDTLRDLLSSQASFHHVPVGYKTAKVDLFGELSLKKKGTQYVFVDVYCELEHPSPGPGYVPDNNIINVEHTWPQSKFGGNNQGAQKSDLHHLFPSDSQLNGVRGNHPFGLVQNPHGNVKCPQSKFGEDFRGILVFEPPVAHRGNVARALFYFSVRYNLPVDETQETVLKEWSDKDPVDASEMERNDEIEEVQGNRNPFIDQPELVHSLENF